MQTALNKLREGHLSFASFAKETHADWVKLAGNLLTRWRAPSAVDLEDLVQELLLGAWIAVEKYDESRGALKPFVVWSAMTAAKRWLNVQRGVSSHNGDKCKSCFDLPVGDMFQWQGETVSRANGKLVNGIGPMRTVEASMPTVEASQERIVMYLQRLQAAARMLYTEQNRTQPSSLVDFGNLEDVLELLIACGETPWSRVGKFLQQTAIQLEE